MSFNRTNKEFRENSLNSRKCNSFSEMDDGNTEPNISAIRNLPVFKGFPYLLTRIVPAVYHIILLPDSFKFPKMINIAKEQLHFNKLDTCLVLDQQYCVYLSPNDAPRESNSIPSGGTTFSRLLKPCIEMTETSDILQRQIQLDNYIKLHNKEGYFFGDLSKGGRLATKKELIQLKGFQSNGIPSGLVN